MKLLTLHKSAAGYEGTIAVATAVAIATSYVQKVAAATAKAHSRCRDGYVGIRLRESYLAC